MIVIVKAPGFPPFKSCASIPPPYNPFGRFHYKIKLKLKLSDINRNGMEVCLTREDIEM